MTKFLQLPDPFPTIVTLCGSTRFKDTFIKVNFEETMKGNIVLTVGFFSHSDSHIHTPTEDEKRKLDELHLRKIDLSDEVLILNVNGYIGESTRKELEYAIRTGKKIRFLEPYTGPIIYYPPPPYIPHPPLNTKTK